MISNIRKNQKSKYVVEDLEGIPFYFFMFFSPGPPEDDQEHLRQYRRAKLMEQLLQKQIALLEILDPGLLKFSFCEVLLFSHLFGIVDFQDRPKFLRQNQSLHPA